MERNTSSIASFGALAVAATLFGTSYTQGPIPPSPAPPTASLLTAAAEDSRTPTVDDSGPWYAVCQEFENDDPYTSPKSKTVIHKPGFIEIPEPANADPEGYEFKSSPAEAASVKRGKASKQQTMQDAGGNTYRIAFTRQAQLDTCIDKSDPAHLPAFKFLIVTVPDPSSSHLDLDFDRDIVAVQEAAADRGYAFQRFWLPWRLESVNHPGGGERSILQQRLREQEPGVLIFRSQSNPAERLIAFIVGETPTGGINRTQFLNALHERQQLCRTNHRCVAEQSANVEILGPTFSGSLPVLVDLMVAADRDPDLRNRASLGPELQATLQPLRFSIISSGANADAAITKFKEWANQVLPGRIAFQSLAIGFNGLFADSIQYLKSSIGTKEGSPKIALIQEDESGFSTAIDIKSVSGPGILQLSFPRDLSSLRNASSDQQGKLSPADLTGQDKDKRTFGIPTSLRQSDQNRHDSPQSFAKEQEAASIDRALQTMVEKLRESDIRAVIVVATNPLDKLFMLQYLHRSLPNVRMATMEADQFMLSAPNYADLSGTLVATGLPLSTNTTIFLHKPGELNSHAHTLEFPSSNAGGVYLAAAAFLYPIDSSTFDNIHDAPADANGDCNDLTAVSKHKFMLLSQKDRIPAVPCMGRSLLKAQGVLVQVETPPIPFVWKAFVGLCSISAFLFLFFQWICFESNGKVRCGERAVLLKDFPTLRGLVPIIGSVDGEYRRYYYWVLSNQLGSLLFLCVSTTLALHAADRWWIASAPAILLYACVATSWVHGRKTFALCKTKSKTSASQFRYKGAKVTMVITAAFPLITVACWLMVLYGNGQSEWQAARDMQFFEGLSPVPCWTVILLAYMGWAVQNLRRLAQIDMLEIRLRSCLPDIATRHLMKLQKNLLRKVRDNNFTSNWRNLALPSMLLLVVCSLLRIETALRGIEHVAFRGWMIIGGFVMLMLTVLFEFERGREIWFGLRHILELLEGTSLERALKSVPKELSGLNIWSVGGRRQSFAVQLKTVDAWREMADGGLATSAAEVGSRNIVMAKPALHQGSFLVRSAVWELIRKEDRGVPVVDSNLHSVDVAIDAVFDSAVAGLLPRRAPEPARSVLDEVINCVRMRRGARFGSVVGSIVACLTDRRSKRKKPEGMSIGQQKAHLNYIALRIIAFIRYVMLQIRNAMTFVVYGYVALLICVTSYPFQGRRSLGVLMSVVFVMLLAGIAQLLVQMDKNLILSRIEGTEGGKASYLSVAGKLFNMGGIPLLAVAASQFPQFTDFIFSWIKPTLETLH